MCGTPVADGAEYHRLVTYEHTQSRPQLAWVIFAVAAAAIILAVVLQESGLIVTPIVLGAVGLVAYALSSLTTTVTAEAVIVAFRWGRPKREIPIGEIVDASAVRNRWWYGWGIRWIPGGTMFNVWGLDAVHLDLGDQRDFRIGSDDAQRLAAAISAQLAQH